MTVAHMCGGSQHPALEMPDLGLGCCYGAVMDGPQACNCWVPVHDQPQQPVVPGLMPLPPVPIRLCPDCAFRPGSPERTGQPGYSGDEDLLDELVATRTPFFCHQGIRRVVRFTHPSGAVVQAHPGDYDPPISGAVPCKADGTPADICAGWLLRRVKEVQR